MYQNDNLKESLDNTTTDCVSQYLTKPHCAGTSALTKWVEVSEMNHSHMFKPFCRVPTVPIVKPRLIFLHQPVSPFWCLHCGFSLSVWFWRHSCACFHWTAMTLTVHGTDWVGCCASCIFQQICLPYLDPPPCKRSLKIEKRIQMPWKTLHQYWCAQMPAGTNVRVTELNIHQL